MIKKGFTLVELIIVLSLIAILVFVAIAFYRGQIFKSRDAKRKADLNRIKVAVEEYEKDHSCYPTPNLVVCNPGTGLSPYLDKIPCDPITNASYFYDYQNSTCPTWYRMFSVLENSKDSSITQNIGPFSAFNYFTSSPNAPLPYNLETPLPDESTPVPTSEPTPGETGQPSPTPTTGTITASDYYGCKNSVCVPIGWDSARPGPECDPNYQSSRCYGQCGNPQSECQEWR